MHDRVSTVVGAAAAPATILVVEDEGLVAIDIQQTLTRLGYLVPKTAASADDAIATATVTPPDLVLMDIKLQGAVDGIDAAGQLRERFDVPIVYLTSYSDDATLARAKETLPFGYVRKPFTERELRTAIEVALHKHGIEKEMVQRERWFSTALQSIDDAVIATDRDERVTFMNQAAESLTTWKAGDALGKRLSEVFKIAGGRKAPPESPVVGAKEARFSVIPPADTSLVTRSGESIVVVDTATPVMNDQGDVLGGLVVFRDVTERRNLEERLAAAERLASIGAMAANMAHEINNPLTYVSLNLSLAKDLAKRIESAGGVVAKCAPFLRDLVAALEDAHQGAERVLQLAKEIRKLASASGTADKKVLDLPDVLDMAVKLTSHVLGPDISVDRRYTVTPYVEASEAQLTQIFVNLLSNAAYAIAEEPTGERRIGVSTRTDEGGRAVVEIRDTGRGISKKDMPRLFDPFFTTKPAGAGTGLGLSICQGIVASLGGEIEAESELGRGATFRVVLLPVAPRREPASSSRMRAQAARRNRVLVVDDEPVMAAAVERVLGEEYDVTIESDGRLALARIATSEPFDLVLCDLRMPGMSGVDIYEALAVSNPETARRLVFISADASSGPAKKLLATITNPVLVKPFSAESLRAIVKEYRR